MKTKTLRHLLCGTVAIFIAASASVFAQVGEREDLTVPGGGSVTCCASHTDLSGTKAFDNGGTADSSRWLANKATLPNAFVTYSFSKKTVVDGYTVVALHSNYSGASRSPKSWSLQGTNDDSDMPNWATEAEWVTVDAQTNQTGWTSLETRYFETATTNRFRHWRFNMHENNGDGTYTGIQELEFYGYPDGDPEAPQVDALAWTHAGTGAVTLNGELLAGIRADAFFAWGDAPDNLANTNAVGEVTDVFSLTLSGLGDFQRYWYTIFVTNALGRAELPEPLKFTTRGAAYYWKTPYAGGEWIDAANWCLEDGTPADRFPNAAGDVAIVTNTTATITLAQTVVIGELHAGLELAWNPVTFTNSAPGAKIVFDNGDAAALLHTRKVNNVPARLYVDWEIRNGLTVRNESDWDKCAVYHYGNITGAGQDIDVVQNIFSRSPSEDMVYTGSITATASGAHFLKAGSHNLTLLGGAHTVRFGSVYTEGDFGGLHGDGTLTISGGTFRNLNAERPFLFTNRDGFVVITNGATYTPEAITRLGRGNGSENSTVIVTGAGSAWDGKTADVHVSHKCRFLLHDGAQADVAKMRVTYAGLVEISGRDPQSGTPSLMNLNGNTLWVAADGPTVPSNRIVVCDGGVLSNGHVRVGGEYTGSTNAIVEVSGGGRVHATLALGQGGTGTEDGTTDNRVVISGEDSMWIYPSAGTVQIGGHGHRTDRNNFVRVEKGGVFTNAAFNIGFSNYYSRDVNSIENHLDILDGGKVFSTQNSAIGPCLTYETTNTVSRNYALVAGGANGDSLWDMGGRELRVGRSNSIGSQSFGNFLEVRAGGSVANVSTLYVGDGNAGTNNFIRLAGGTIDANNFTLNATNHIAVTLTPDGLPECSVNVAGTATFGIDTCVIPAAERNARVGEYVLLRAAQPFSAASMKNLTLAPAVDSALWKLRVTEHEVILRHMKPGTTLIVK